MTPKLRHRAMVLKTMFPDCYREVDGYWVWWRQGEALGAWTAADLRVMAEILDEANRKWDAEVTQYFEDNPVIGEDEDHDREQCSGEHRYPEGPNEDLGQCSACGLPTAVLRPVGETIGFHAEDCSLESRHRGRCVGGGSGHPPAPVIRGYWPGFEEDVARERARWEDGGANA